MTGELFGVEFGRWLDLQSVDRSPQALVVSLSFQADAIALVFLGLFLFAATLAGIRGIDSDDRRQGWQYAFLLVGLTLSMGVLLTACNLVVLLIAWEVSALLASQLANVQQTGNSARRQTGFFLVLSQQLSSLSLLGAVLLCGSVFSTLDLREIAAGQALETIAADHTAFVGGISAFLLIAILSRCSLVPFLISTDQFHLANFATAVLLQTGVFFVSGLYLLIRMMPLLADNLQITGALMTLAALTAVLAPLVAVFEANSRQRRLYLALTLFAVSVAGLCTLTVSGTLAAITLLAVSLFVQCSWACEPACCNIAREHTDGHPDAQSRLRSVPFGLTLVSTLVLASGVFGQNSVLASLREMATLERTRFAVEETRRAEQASDSLAAAETEDIRIVNRTAIFEAAYRMTVVSMFLTAVALFLPICNWWRRDQTGPAAPVTAENQPTRKLGWEIAQGLLLSAAIGMGILLPPAITPLFSNPADDATAVGDKQQIADSLAVIEESGAVAVIAGVVIAFLATWLTDQRRSQLGKAMGPLVRLGRRRFYAADVLRYVLIAPARVFSLLLGWLDTRLLTSLFGGLLTIVSCSLDRLVRPLRAEGDSIVGITTLLMVSALLIALCW